MNEPIYHSAKDTWRLEFQTFKNAPHRKKLIELRDGEVVEVGKRYSEDGWTFRLQSNRTGRNDVVNYHSRILDHDPVDHQPQDLLLRLEGGVLQRLLHALAELLQSPHQPNLQLPICPLPADLGEPPL